MVIGAIAAAMIASTVVTSDVSASCGIFCGGGDSDEAQKERTNNNLDRHIEKGGAHGSEAQKIKDRLNGDSGSGCGGTGD